MIYINKLLFELDCDLFIKDSLLNMIFKISNKKEYKNEIPNKLLINITREIIKLSNLPSNNSENSTFFSNKESILLSNEKRINILIDILYNFLIEKSNNISKSLDDSIFHNLCFYINNQKVNKDNKNKIIKILKNNEKELIGNVKNIYEIAEKTKILEENSSDKEKIKSMIYIEEKIKDGYELNINTTNTLNNIITNNYNNSEIMYQAISLINTNVKNNHKVDFIISEKLINMFLNQKAQLSKKVFDNLIICLMNIVKNCKLEEQLSNALYGNLLDFNKRKVLNRVELLTISLKILTQKHYSFNKEQILNCINFLSNENISKSNPKFEDIENIILNSFNNQNLEKEIFNALFELFYKNIDFLDCISLCLLNSLKNKKQEEINILINWNMKKFENLILNNNINNCIINMLCKASFDIFYNYDKEKPFLLTFVFFTIKMNELKISQDIESLLILIAEDKIKICENHIRIIEDNLNINGSFSLYIKMKKNNRKFIF